MSSTIYVYLLALRPGVSADSVISEFDPDSLLLKGVPYGWVHEPHKTQRDFFLGKKWDLFLITDDHASLPSELLSSSIFFETTIPYAEFTQLHKQRGTPPQPSNTTPPLPPSWLESSGIPPSAINTSTHSPLKPGELHLDKPMATFLSTALPPPLAQKPISLFNLFKYAKASSAVHDAYMARFKETFGTSAGAVVKFMGPVPGSGEWDEANLTQYDTIWHYAYMLSTEAYRPLNAQKVQGLEDTCILVVSEI